ncbi:hypothetical protein MBLNU230_g6906t1 [Neophaeotheca triangularis]
MFLSSDSQIGSQAIAAPRIVDPDSSEALEYTGLPPFPEHVPQAPLLRISLRKLLAKDDIELSRLWKASCELGFFYLDLRDASEDRDDSGTKRDSAHSDLSGKSAAIDGDAYLKTANQLFSLGEEVFSLPVEEKQKYDFKDQGSYFGYKGLGAGIIDKSGTRDRNEFYNISKDDILGLSDPLPAPSCLQARSNRDLLETYIRQSHAIVTLLLSLLNDKLGLPTATLQNLHKLPSPSGDQVRWVHSPRTTQAQIQSTDQKSLGEHTDFGSLTLLHNRLSGLQILPPASPTWSYVKPLRGHCVCNLGDSMVKFTAGVLRSNLHRVVSPAGQQAGLQRMSLVYFCRPEDEVVLRAVEGSGVVDAAKRESGEGEETVSAKEWVLRRALGRRVGGDFGASEGTEGGRG